MRAEHFAHHRSRRRAAGAPGAFGAALALLIALAPGAARATTTGAGVVLPRPAVLEGALAAYRRVQATGLLQRRLLTVIDYSLPSSERRLWVIDPDRLRVLFHEYVSHGRGSSTDDDPNRAVLFGNDPESHRSSLGTFLTGETYAGKHGRSLALIGLDPGVNDRALERRIVIHPAPYVSKAFRAEKEGRVGLSWGCPALDPVVASAIINRIQDGSVLFVAGAGPSAPTFPYAVAAMPRASVATAPATPARSAIGRRHPARLAGLRARPSARRTVGRRHPTRLAGLRARASARRIAQRR